LFLLGGIIGLTVGFLVWLVASHWVAVYIAGVEDRQPALVGSKQLRVMEAVICGALFLACLALASWIARLVWVQAK